MCTSQTLTSKASHLSEMNKIISYYPGTARILSNLSPFLVVSEGELVSPASGSLCDVHRMLKQFFHTLY